MKQVKCAVETEQSKMDNGQHTDFHRYGLRNGQDKAGSVSSNSEIYFLVISDPLFAS